MPRPIALFAALLAAAAAPAQNLPSDPLAALRNKNTLAAEDRAKLADWIRGRLDLVAGNDLRAAADVRKAAQGSEAFQKAYATELARQVGQRLASAAPPLAVRLLALLAAVGHSAPPDDIAAVLITALNDRRPAVRAAAIVALRALRERIRAAGGALPGRVRTALRDSGPNVKAYVPLLRLYEALDLGGGNAQQEKADLAALIAVLEKRAAAYQNDTVPGEGAEAAGFEIIARKATQLDADGRKRLLTAAGAILRHAVRRYLDDLMDVKDQDSRVLVQQRDRIERLMLAGQRLLVAVLKPSEAPALHDALARQRDAAAIKRAWNRWAAILKPITGQDYSLP